MSLNSIFQYFVPKDKKVFFPLFEQAASNAVVMATILVETVNSDNPATREEVYNHLMSSKVIAKILSYTEAS